MAKNPENAMELMMSVWPLAIKRVDEEVKDMQKLANLLGDDIKLISIKPTLKSKAINKNIIIDK